jgi:hypothetical protein
MKNLVLLPYPQSVEFIEGCIVDYNIEPTFLYDNNCGDEEYYITAENDNIIIRCKGELGKSFDGFYGGAIP